MLVRATAAREVRPCMAALEQFIHGEAQAIRVSVKAALAHVQYDDSSFSGWQRSSGAAAHCAAIASGWCAGSAAVFEPVFGVEPSTMPCWIGCAVRAIGKPGWIFFFWKAWSRPPAARCRRPGDWWICFSGCAVGAEWWAWNNQRAARTRCPTPAARVQPAPDRPKCGHYFPYRLQGHADAGHAGHRPPELTGQRRNRVFVYDGYLNILNEGSEAP